MTKKALSGQTFAHILRDHINELKQHKRFVSEAGIAKRAEIDPATFSTLKSDTTNRRSVFNVLKYRLQLAAALGRDPEEMTALARKFISAEPALEVPFDELDGRVKKLAIRFLQSDIKHVEIALPLFFDSAPFVVAERQGYFRDAGLSKVRLDYVKWPKTLDYLRTSARPADEDSIESANENLDKEIRLAVYNRESILSEGEEDVIFCFPLAIYDPKNFVLWGRKGDCDVTDANWRAILTKLYSSKGEALRIIISGEDMRQGVKRAFEGIGPVDSCFVMLDQFDAPEAFLRGLGDLWVGGVPQSMTAQSPDIVVVVNGNEIGLARQFNGLVCHNDELKFTHETDLTREEMQSLPSRKLLLQILWAWYRAIHYLDESDKNLDEEAEFVTARMNVYAGTLKYDPSDFKEFWKGRANTFEIPGSPKEMMKKISSSDDFSFRVFDRTRDFADELEKLSTLLPNS